MNSLKFLVVMIVVLMATSSAKAANDQEKVFGIGLGYHRFTESDDTRKGTEEFEDADEKNGTLSLKYFFEWYALGNIGIGLQNELQSTSRTYSFEDGSELKHTWTITHLFVTLNVIPIGGTSSTRLGLFAGQGISWYGLTEELSGTEDYSDYSKSADVSGSATILGIYFDWGGEAFGMRIGYRDLTTSYPDMKINDNKYEVSASGNAFYFTFRWALK